MVGGFFKVPNKVFEEKLSLIEFCVYCYLLRCDNPKNGCYPSKNTISKACGIAVSSVSKAISLLERRGMIEITHNYQSGCKQNNTYQILR